MPSTELNYSKDVRDFVVSNFLFEAATLQDDTSFLDSGTVDRLKIATDEIRPDNLDSINRVVRFVTSKLGADGKASVFQDAVK